MICSYKLFKILYQNIYKLIKLFKDIDLFKIVINKKSYIFYIIKKAQKASHKFHIRFKKRSLNLIHNDVYDLIIFRDRFNDKYFTIFIND